MNDPREKMMNPFWPQTLLAPFGIDPTPPALPPGTWGLPPAPPSLPPSWDSSQIPVPPAAAPWFTGPAFPHPAEGNRPAWMNSVTPAEESRGLLNQLSRVPVDPMPPAYGSPYQDMPAWPQPTAPAVPFPYPTAPLFNHLEPNGLSLWQAPITNVDFRGPTSPPLDDDPFARAARRIRQSVQPEGGRMEGPATHVLQNYVPHMLHGLATLPQRVLGAAGEFYRTSEYDPGPALEVAGLTVGTPLTPRGALGSSAGRPRRLPMDEASRMRRADAMGFRRDMPLEFGTAPVGEKISAAAFKLNGRLFQAPMHYEALEEAERVLGMLYSEMRHDPIPEGFVTNAGRYVSRAEAGDIARRASQTGQSGQFGRELASEEAKMSDVAPSSTAYTGATAPGLPGGEGPWGWVVPEALASAPLSPSGRRTRPSSTSEMGASATQANQGAAIPPGPIWHWSERPTSLDARGAAQGEIQASLKKAWDQGYDAVIVKNYTAPGGRTGTVLVLKDLAQLRSPFAKFDPTKRNSSDLLAGLAGAGVLAPVALQDGESR